MLVSRIRYFISSGKPPKVTQLVNCTDESRLQLALLPPGGSHGIGHQLGPIGVPHAETTCVCLPAVQKYNARVNAPQQAIVLDAFWADPDICGVLTKHGLVQGEADLGDALDAVIRELGLPRTLNDYGIGRDRLEAIAESCVTDICCVWNVIPLEKKEQVLEILQMCVGD